MSTIQLASTNIERHETDYGVCQHRTVISHENQPSDFTGRRL